MKYIIVCDYGTDLFAEEFNNREKAVKKAKDDFARLDPSDQRRIRSYVVIKSINPDPEAENHFDGDIVFKLK